MKNNTLTHIITLFLILLSLSLSGMQQNTQANALQRWKLTVRHNNFEAANRIFDDVTVILRDHILSGSLEHDKDYELAFKLKGPHSEIVEKLKCQPWFTLNNLREDRSQQEQS
jgi:hypothetical protein